MKSLRRTVSVVFLVSIGVVGFHMRAVEAQQFTHTGSAVFTGTVSITPGLFTPVAPSCGLGLCPDPNHAAWWINASGEGEDGSSVAPTSVAGPDFSVQGGGSLNPGLGDLGPYCGYSSGSGMVHWSFSGVANVGGGGHHGSALIHWATTAGGNVFYHSDITANFLVTGFLTVLNRLEGESCQAGTATSFIVVGNVQITR